MSPRTSSAARIAEATQFRRIVLRVAVVGLLCTSTLRAGDDVPNLNVQNIPDADIAAFTVQVVRPADRFETSATFLLLQASSGNPVYATVTHPFPLLSPHWINRAVSPDFNPAFDIGVRRLFDGGGDIRLGWTHLNSFDDASTVSANPVPPAPAGMPPLSGTASTQALGPTYLVGPPLPFATANAVLHSAFDAVDLDAGLTLAAGRARVRPFAGLQYARISQRLATDFRSVGNIFSFRDDTDSLFSGVGPRVGVDMRYVAGNLDILGGIAGSTLIGRRSSSIDFLTVSPQDAAAGIPLNVQSLTSPNTTQVVPGLDARLGAAYSIPVGRCGLLRCEGGYRAAVYVSAVNQYSLSEVEDQLTSDNNEGSEATFLRTAVEVQRNFLIHGPYLRLSLQF